MVTPRATDFVRNRSPGQKRCRGSISARCFSERSTPAVTTRVWQADNLLCNPWALRRFWKWSPLTIRTRGRTQTCVAATRPSGSDTERCSRPGAGVTLGAALIATILIRRTPILAVLGFR